MANRYQKEFESFRKRLGKFSIWFDALVPDKRWHLFFEWKKFKWIQTQNDKSISLRKFLYEKKKTSKYWVSNQKIREHKINKIFN